MTVKVVIPLCGSPDTHGARELMQQRYAFEFAEVLELTLVLWSEIASRDHDLLITALERPLDRHLFIRHKRVDFEEFINALHVLATALSQLHETLHRVLSPIVDNVYCADEVDLRLKGWMSRGAIVEIIPRNS